MKCEVAQERIVAAAYGELAEEQVQELERHLDGCPECGKEREQVLALKVLAGAHPVMEPDANLVARSRLKLDAALDALPPRNWYDRLSQQMRNNIAGLWAAPVAACLLLTVGAGAGLLGSNVMAANRARHTATTQTTQAQGQPDTSAGAAAPVEIANISSIVREPNSHRVEVRYNQLVPQRIEGSLDDPAIRQLLMLASEDTTSTGVRDDSVGLMAAECKAGHGCQKAAGIRDALMVALR
jgi:anti-sigma factor RsiW